MAQKHPNGEQEGAHGAWGVWRVAVRGRCTQWVLVHYETPILSVVDGEPRLLREFYSVSDRDGANAFMDILGVRATVSRHYGEASLNAAPSYVPAEAAR